MGDKLYSLSVPTTFGWDCLKEICKESHNEGNASDCHDPLLSRPPIIRTILSSPNKSASQGSTVL